MNQQTGADREQARDLDMGGELTLDGRVCTNA